MKKLAVLIDFTSVCEIAIEHAAIIARYTLSPLILVNISDPSKIEEEKEIKERIKTHARLLDREGIPYLAKIGYGEFFSTIPNFLKEIGADFIIVGTHGIKGIADVSYGLNILRLINSLNLPALIVQGHSEAPAEGYDQILIPNVLTNSAVTDADRIKRFAQLFKAKITLLQYARTEVEAKTGEDIYTKQFQELGYPLTYDFEIVSTYIHSYYRSILQYAAIEDVNLLVWTTPSEGEHFDQEDKENLILNRLGIPVLYLPVNNKSAQHPNGQPQITK